jgi:hypothetical protein
MSYVVVHLCLDDEFADRSKCAALALALARRRRWSASSIGQEACVGETLNKNPSAFCLLIRRNAFDDFEIGVEDERLGDVLLSLISVGDGERVGADVHTVQFKVQILLADVGERLCPVRRQRLLVFDAYDRLVHDDGDARRMKYNVVGVVIQNLVEVASVPVGDPFGGERLCPVHVDGERLLRLGFQTHLRMIVTVMIAMVVRQLPHEHRTAAVAHIADTRAAGSDEFDRVSKRCQHTETRMRQGKITNNEDNTDINCTSQTKCFIQNEFNQRIKAFVDEKYCNMHDTNCHCVVVCFVFEREPVFFLQNIARHFGATSTERPRFETTPFNCKKVFDRNYDSSDKTNEKKQEC